MPTQSQAERDEARIKRSMRHVDVTVLGRHYRLGRIPPLEVIGISRRLAPFIRPIVGFGVSLDAFRSMVSQDEAGEAGDGEAAKPKEVSRLEAFDRLSEAGAPILEALARMPEADQNYIIAACLKVTFDQDNRVAPEMWSAESEKPISMATAGEVLALTAEHLKLVIPEFWSELSEVRESFVGIIATAMTGTKAA